jgi:hypothetical protein
MVLVVVFGAPLALKLAMGFSSDDANLLLGRLFCIRILFSQLMVLPIVFAPLPLHLAAVFSSDNADLLVRL